MIENIKPQLEGFFVDIINAIIPTERSAYNINEPKKTIVGLCYQMAGLRNKFVNQYKLEVGLYLIASRATWEAIDTISSLGYLKNLFHVYNIDDYHSIYENRKPDTTSTSTAKHFATCVAKPVFECPSVPLIFNGVSIHNPANVESPRICWYLLKQYTGVFDISYLDYQLLRVSQGRLIITKYDQIDLLTIHSYADNIIEHKEEHSMNGLKLKHLASFNEYYVENMHSRIRANTSHNATTDNIIKQAYVIMNHDPTFKDTYSKVRRYPYSIKALDFLYDKMALSLLKHFQEVFYNRGISVPITTEEIDKEIAEKITNETIKKNTKKTIGKATITTKKAMKKVVDKPTKQPTKKTTKKNYKKKKTRDILSRHFERKSGHSIPSNGIFENINSFLKRIEKGADILTSEDLDNDKNNVEEDIEEQPEVEEV
ncbi:hypothetical protein C2G38_2249226 [Gigaspora rosea]|uniref:Uncharacterized protein n=1 Tax=Gigaspora rosea TaxID=44941 RepID=A0A397UZ65_9GLOM|nr:hypothetical protein C2G38_2249226 [Gigaspora rosea]